MKTETYKLDDLPDELSEVIRLVLYHMDKLAQRPSEEYLSYSELTPKTGSIKKQLKIFTERVLKLRMKADLIPTVIESLGSIDRNKQPNLYKYMVLLWLDIIKYDIDNAHQKSGLRRYIERSIKRLTGNYFLRKKRTEKFVLNQIATIGGKIIVNSLKCASSLDTNFQSITSHPLTPLMFSQITVEYLMLFIHLTDRVLFQLFGPKDRTKYIDLLVALITDTLKGDSFSESFPKFRKTLDVEEKVRISPTMRNKADDYIIADVSIFMDTFFIDELNMRTIEYTKYKNITPNGDNSPQGTLLWEFGKNISFVIYDHQNDTDTIKLSSELAAKYYANIDVIILLTKVT